MFGPPSDDLSDGVVAEGVTRNRDRFPTHLLHNVLLLLELGGACHDDLDHAEAVAVDTEVVYLLLNLLKNKVENSIESF